MSNRLFYRSTAVAVGLLMAAMLVAMVSAAPEIYERSQTLAGALLLVMAAVSILLVLAACSLWALGGDE